MAYRVNGKTYLSLAQATKAAEKFFQKTGVVVAVEKSKRGVFNEAALVAAVKASLEFQKEE